MQPQVKGLTIMVDSQYNGWRMEDVWLDRQIGLLRSHDGGNLRITGTKADLAPSPQGALGEQVDRRNGSKPGHWWTKARCRDTTGSFGFQGRN
jgi:hypothetical protein